MAQHMLNIPQKERVYIDIVRLKKGGLNFEVALSDPDAALKLRKGDTTINIRDVLQAPDIFSDAKKGERASEAEMKKLFRTEDRQEIAKIIIITGDFHLTEEQKRKIIDQKKNKIIDYIFTNAVDPKTRLPHPKQRIELAMEQIKYNISMYESVTSQTDEIVKKLLPILPLSFEKSLLRISIPQPYASKLYSNLKSNYECKNEAWNNDGSVMVELELQAGKKQAVFDLVNKITKGEAHITETRIK